MSLPFEHAAQYEANIGGPFGDASREVGVPVFAVRDVSTNREAIGCQSFLQIAANPVEHLKLVTVFGDLVFFDVNLTVFDNALVVRGDAGVIAKLEVAVQQTAELHVYGVLVGEGFAFWLEVCAFDDA